MAIFVMKLVVFVLVTACIATRSEVVDVIISIQRHFRSGCVYLIYEPRPKLTSDTFCKDTARQLMNRNVPVAVVDPSALTGSFNCGRNKPLYVISTSEQFTNDSLHKITTRTHMSDVVWLLFLNSDLHLDELFPGVNIPFDCEFLVVHRNLHSSVVLTEVYRLNSTLPLKTYAFGNWTDGRGFSFSTFSFYQRRSNLEGIPLKTGSIQLPAKYISSQADEREIGYMDNVWKTLETHLNFTTEIHNPRDERRGGTRRENGSWTGVFGTLQRREVDVTNVVLQMTAVRLDIMDYTVPAIDVKTCMIIKRPNSYDLQWDMFQSFSRPLWISVACAMLLLILVTYIHSWFQDKSCSILTAMLLVIGAYCQQGDSDKSRTISARVTRLTLYLSSLVIFSLYSAAFTSDLTLQEPVMPFNSFEEFLADGSYKLGMMPQSAHIEYFKNSTQKLYMDIYSRMIAPHERTLNKNDVVGLRRLCHVKNYAYFTSTYNLMKKGYLPNCKISLIRQACFPGHIAIAIAKESPYLGLFNYKLQTMRRVGILSRLRSRFSQMSPYTEEETRKLSVELRDTAPTLIILASGLGLSLFIGVVEMFLPE